MKKILLFLVLATGLLYAADRRVGLYRTFPGQYSSNLLFDVSEFDRLSVQCVYSTTTFATATFIDGAKSYASITLPASTTTLVGTTIWIAGVPLVAGTDYTIGTSSVTTAKAISNAIMANATLSTIIASTHTLTTKAVITATATSVGFNQYSLSASTTAIVLSGPQFTVGLASDVDLTNDTIYEPSHGYVSSLQVLLNATAGTVPTGLTNKATYYVIPVSDSYFKLATTSTGAIAASGVNLTAVTGSGTFTLTPRPWAVLANNGFYWQASNDGSNFYSLPTATVSSVTYSTAGNYIWDFGSNNYRYLRAVYTQPTNCGINLDFYINGVVKE